ncbi:MAG: T9SS type A sorting domain-containing protein [Ichthyobacteriaceae bacterium]|nr:T9SS type A sorting domain-containing protein [Ichthyobacteriaceae bacterium]
MIKKRLTYISLLLGLCNLAFAQPFGNNMYFDGHDDIIDAGNDAAFRPSSITVEFWIKANFNDLHEGEEILRNRYLDNNITPNQGMGYLITYNNGTTKNQASGDATGLRLGVGGHTQNTNGDAAFENIWSYSPSDNPDNTGNQLPLSTIFNGTTWHHIAFTYTYGSTFSRYKTFLDGKLVSTRSAGLVDNTPINYGTTSNLSGLIIGGGNTEDFNARFRIDEIRIWNKELTESQISAMKDHEIENNSGAVKLVGGSNVSGLNYNELVAYYKFNNTYPDNNFSNGVTNFASNNLKASFKSGADITNANIGNANCTGVAEWIDNGIDDYYADKADNWKDGIIAGTLNNVVRVNTATGNYDPQFKDALTYEQVFIYHTENTKTPKGAYFSNYPVTGNSLNTNYIKIYNGTKFTIGNDNNTSGIKDVISVTLGDVENNGNINIESNSKLTVNNKYSGSGTTELESDINRTASLITNTTQANIIGDFKANRYFKNNDTWYDFTLPVQSNLTAFGGSRVYHHNEDRTANGNPWVVASTSENAKTMEGYTVKTTSALGNNIAFSGTLNSGDKSFTLTSTYYGDTEYYGWNHIGNPYSSAINWDLVYTDLPVNTKISSTIHVKNATIKNGNNNQWLFYNASLPEAAPSGGTENTSIKIIPIGQGFSVFLDHSNAGDGNPQISESITLKNSYRIHDNNNKQFSIQNTSGKKLSKNNEKKLRENYLMLELTNSEATDRVFYHLRSDATKNFDNKYDTYKMPSNGANFPGLFINTLDNQHATIQQEAVATSVEIGVDMEASGEVELSMPDVSFTENIILEDKVENTFTNLKNNNYSFYHNTDDENRFVLHFEETSALSEKPNTPISDAVIYKSSNQIIVKTNANVSTISIYNMQGVLITKSNFNNKNTEYILNSNVKSGVYVIVIEGENNRINKKIML